MKEMRFLLPLLTLGACTVGPNYAGPPAIAGDAVRRGTFVRAGDPALVQGPALARWWESLGDPTLTALVDDALAHSPTIDIATARIRQAHAQLSGQRAAQLPSVSASASYLHARLPGVGVGSTGTGSDAAPGATAAATSSSFDFFNLAGTASWEPDLFGGGRRGVEQVRAQLGKSYAALADA